jgi:putative acyl-CoA dehydrogenase
MARVLADLALEQEAALALSFRVARAFDEAAASEPAAAIARIVTPIAKYWICKRAPGLVQEAMECLGGNGYVEESPLPRLFRQSPLNSIWEGSGNVIALDTLRAVRRSPETLDALFLELDQARGGNATLDGRVARLKDLSLELDEASARRFVETAALALQAATLVRTAPAFVAEGFVSARLGDQAGYTYGAGALRIDPRRVLSRAMRD